MEGINLPMQNSVAATSIANLIFPLYPALSIASLTRSKASEKLANQNKQTLAEGKFEFMKIMCSLN